MSDVLAVAEHRQGKLRDVSFELITAARESCPDPDDRVHVAVIGGETHRFADRLNLEGVDQIYTVDRGEEFNHDVYVQVLEQLYREVGPDLVLVPHSVIGLDYAPVLAAELDLPLVTDAISLSPGEPLRIDRQLYGAKVSAEVVVDEQPNVVTIRPNTWEPAESAGEAEITSFEATVDSDAIRSEVTGFDVPEKGDVDLSEEDFIISIGRGIEEEDNLDLIQELVEVSGAALGASRPLVDNDWLPDHRQVGQSGATVTPTVYLAIGISGAVQHVAGMKGSETIIAINTDPDAPIFDIADYGIVGDLFEVVPELIEALK